MNASLETLWSLQIFTVGACRVRVCGGLWRRVGTVDPKLSPLSIPTKKSNVTSGAKGRPPRMEARPTRRSSRSNAATTASTPTECAQGVEHAGSVACENPAQSPTPFPLPAQRRCASTASLRQHVCVFCSCATIALSPLTSDCLIDICFGRPPAADADDMGCAALLSHPCVWSVVVSGHTFTTCVAGALPVPDQRLVIARWHLPSQAFVVHRATLPGTEACRGARHDVHHHWRRA